MRGAAVLVVFAAAGAACGLDIVGGAVDPPANDSGAPDSPSAPPVLDARVPDMIDAEVDADAAADASRDATTDAGDAGLREAGTSDAGPDASPPPPTLTYVITTPPAAPVSLTTEGTVDWAYFGDPTVQRKANVATLIGSLAPTPSGAPASVAGVPSFAWTDGKPTPASTDMQSASYGPAPLDIVLDVPASATSRTLVWYVGGHHVDATFQAKLGALSRTDMTQKNQTGNFWSRIAVTFSSASPATLQLHWSLATAHDGGSFVAVSAATLH